MQKFLCAYPQCQNPVNVKGSYCSEHQNCQIVRKKQKYGESSKLYNTREWRAIRKKILQRDNYTCQICGSELKPVVDHIIPHRDDMELFLDDNNLITLCKVCHDNKTRKEIQQRKNNKKEVIKEMNKTNKRRDNQ